MPFKRAAHEHIQAMLFAVKNDGEWNVHVPPKVDIVGICNVMDDEVARVERFSVAAVVVRVVVTCRGS